MGFLATLFSEEELKALDDNERQTLRDAIVQQVQKSPEIAAILEKMRQKN